MKRLHFLVFVILCLFASVALIHTQTPSISIQHQDENPTPARVVYVQGTPIKISETKDFGVLMVAQPVPFGLGFGKYIAVAFLVQNRSSITLDFDPCNIQAEENTKRKSLRHVSSDEIIGKVGKRYNLLALGQALQAFGSSSSGSFSGYDSSGNTYTGRYSTYAPADPYVQQQRMQAIRQQQADALANIRALSRGRQTMPPGSYVFGYCYFSRPKKNASLGMIVPVGDKTFKFSIP